ncbi:hypothetical protein AJ79_00755 [Helicocarpus griseus UAMH5409]|uniref:Methyltransferase domain-containing protein n=1 Tax=Helicocarpus griseus UAMH5409 TaxID=1447875 RepID=A0A2B7YC08_9EURO|nr:hypothetical protein AJ79_00755 [Helicocarpus griseus UAMH5409]
MCEKEYTAWEDITKSVTLSLNKYLEQNRRVRGAYKDEEQTSADDGMKIDRLELQHQLFHITLDGKLHLAPIAENPRDVLDIATGDPNWVFDFAARHPSASVVANDLSPARPKRATPNIVFQVGEANETWTYSQRFDYIHCRQNHRRIEEHRLFEQGLKFLKPGGWMEMQELCNPIVSDDGTLAEDSSLAKWAKLLVEASAKLKRPADNPRNYASWMQEAGFTNVQTVVHKWPINPWPEDEREKLKGLWNLYNVLERLEKFTTALLTKALGWGREEVHALLVDVRAEMQNEDVHAYFPV